ncbi:hypothetical protein SAMN05660653_00393 [Desulfonatronum thiosulfatophilum]|uniref:Uncharacterized protein n=1 Tax=Desulfonatronum thiosulfatophilum TaxID=617002 RepID=A0A1G6AJ24_9BACT|nr:hypothetical protein [Desulfonatronum thiosulfatophilum]SDB08366.1 hypothetical protein SAMN05660653_00393 [Desulfonatronum thiosulfatophilum]
MKVTTLILSAFLLFCPVQAGAFKTLAGIELGTEMDSYWDLLHQDTATELPDVLFMKEVKLKPGAIPGVRGGSLSYSVCGDQKLVARMKLKFVDRDEQLFRDLDRLYRERWGRPDQWAGDHFRTIQAWLWLLGDEQETVEVILMHSKLDDMRPGVSIKMTHLTLWEEERACWERQLDRESPPLDAEAMQIRNLEDFVPH